MSVLKMLNKCWIDKMVIEAIRANATQIGLIRLRDTPSDFTSDFSLISWANLSSSDEEFSVKSLNCIFIE